jgi:glycosyltransferase involved in cell wall biosynthesis
MSNTTLLSMTESIKPLISVLFPVFEFDANFESAIKSVLSQTLPDFEIILLYPYGQEIPKKEYLHDKRLKLYSCPALWNLSKILNFGIKLSRGEFIARMDSDDIAERSRFEDQVRFLRENKFVSMCGSWAELFGAENYLFQPAERWDELRVDFLFGCQFIHPSVMFRKQTVLEKSLFYDEAAKATEDFELWSRWIEVSPMANLPKILLRYRRHSSSATVRNKEIGESIYKEVMGKLLIRGGFTISERELEIHFKAFNGKEIDFIEFQTLELTLSRLLSWNTKIKFYSEHYLDAMVNNRLKLLKSHWNF